MTFKTVNGLGREHYVAKAFETAMANFANPSYVDVWIEWFDKQEGDKQHAGAVATPVEKLTGEMVRELEAGAASSGVERQGCIGCFNAAAVVCADDCLHPEYYAADLEEVAVLQTVRVKNAVMALCAEHRDILPPAIHRDISVLMEELGNELKTPGYVEALLPE